MQAGFTLLELMIVIAIIAILSAIGFPAYHNHLRKAALTDLLQLVQPYKMAVEFCALEQGKLPGCNADSHGIPSNGSSRYVQRMIVTSGKINVVGKKNLQGLTLQLLPQLYASTGQLTWEAECKANDKALQALCMELFSYNESDASA